MTASAPARPGDTQDPQQGTAGTPALPPGAAAASPSTTSPSAMSPAPAVSAPASAPDPAPAPSDAATAAPASLPAPPPCAPSADASAILTPVPSSAPWQSLEGSVPSLRDLTTLRVGGDVAALVDSATEWTMVGTVRAADREGRPVLVLGGGSNLFASDRPFDGVVVRDVRRVVRQEDLGDGRVQVTASAGMPWDALVCWSLAQGLSGLEALSGIPGSVGAAPVQNVGAYGHEVSETLSSVRAWDRALDQVVELPVDHLGLGYRTSVIKRSLQEPGSAGRTWGPTGRWVVLEATFTLEASDQSAPVLYAELARRLGAVPGGRVPALAVREAVLGLRRSKGMVLDPDDHDTWSAGSFFTNPILPTEAAEALLPPDAPRFDAGEGLVKGSAAWLIDRAGFPRGFAPPTDDEGGPRATLSTRHVLALTNRGRATSEDLEVLARTVREGVRDEFGIELVPEPVTLGIDL